MFPHVILGLLRDGHPRHGYELISTYRTRSGLDANPGNFYRELAKMVCHGLIAPVDNPKGADPRRIPYGITAIGEAEFDQWLAEPGNLDGDLNGWLLFADRLSLEDRARCLDRLQEDLWLLDKSLLRARDDLLAAARRRGAASYHAAGLVLLRRIKQVTAELEFLEEVRRELDAAVALPAAPEPSVTVTADRRGAHAPR